MTDPTIPTSSEMARNAVWRAFNLARGSPDPDGLVNITPLWVASGRKRGWSPRSWNRRNVASTAKGFGQHTVRRFDGSRPGDPAGATEIAANSYVTVLDHEVARFMYGLVMARMSRDPAGAATDLNRDGVRLGRRAPRRVTVVVPLAHASSPGMGGRHRPCEP